MVSGIFMPERRFELNRGRDAPGAYAPHRRCFYTQKYARNGVKLREQAEATGVNKRSKKGVL